MSQCIFYYWTFAGFSSNRHVSVHSGGAKLSHQLLKMMKNDEGRRAAAWEWGVEGGEWGPFIQIRWKTRNTLSWNTVSCYTHTNPVRRKRPIILLLFGVFFGLIILLFACGETEKQANMVSYLDGCEKEWMVRSGRTCSAWEISQNETPRQEPFGNV